MNRVSLATLIGLAGLIAGGCGGSSADRQTDGPPTPPVGMLRLVNGAAELEASLKAGFTTIQSDVSTSLPTDAGADFTGTYTQEQNVDEFDAVRYDGTHLYIAPQRYISCCFLAAQGDGGATPPAPARAIRILSTDPANGSASEVSTIPLEENVSVQGMYVAEGRMFALTSEAYYGSYGGFWSAVAIWAPEKLGFQLYDTSDPASPVLKFQASIDGVFIESRRIGDTVYIVSRYAPAIEGLEYPVTTAQQQAHNAAILRDLSLDELLPKIQLNGATQTLVDPENCYIAGDAADAGYPIITSITAVPISAPETARTTCYNEEAYGVYVSEAAIYLTQLRADEALSRNFTRVHKFALTGAALAYRGSADVAGEVWRGGQADFRMSEHDGDLRIVASEFDWNSTDFVDHRLYILRESATATELRVVAQLPNDSHPEEIGKPNEALYGVRFIGDRAYLVTFEQIDPLYVIDLADSADPRPAGQLEITGFSDFLHPVGDDLLLGLGAAASGGIKVELFDVSDIARPLSRGSSTLGGPGSYSEARHDRHAFTYQPDVGGIDRFTLPADLYSEDGSYEFVESGLYLFEIRDKRTPNLATLNAVGGLITYRPNEDVPVAFAGRNRAYLHGDTVYYVRDEELWAAFWSAPTALNGPF